MKRNIRVTVPFGGNLAMLKECLESLVKQVPEYSDYIKPITVLNDTMVPINWELVGTELTLYCEEIIPPVWLVHTQMLNWIINLTKESGEDWAIGFHTDAYLLPGGFKILMDTIEKAETMDKVALVDTGAFMLLYGINMKFVEEENWQWDPQLFPMYFEDNHFHAIMKSTGWNVLASEQYNVAAFHYGSHMIKDNPIQSRRNDLTFPRCMETYRMIWGGLPGQETRIGDRTANGTRK